MIPLQKKSKTISKGIDYPLLWSSLSTEHIELGYVVLKSKIYELFLVELEQF